MTTLNTIIEEENTPDTEEKKPYLRISKRTGDLTCTSFNLPFQTHVDYLFGGDIKIYINLDPLLSSRDTYWKERVRKEVKEMAGKTVWNAEGKPHISAPDLLQALDNLK